MHFQRGNSKKNRPTRNKIGMIPYIYSRIKLTSIYFEANFNIRSDEAVL